MAFEAAQLDFFAHYIQSQLGIVYGETNYFQLESRLKEVVAALGFASEAAFWEKTQSGIHGDLKQFLLDIATNNETSFFRDPAIFKAIESYCIPALIAGGQNSPLRIWSAACSTGQEPYSLALMMGEMEKKRALSGFDIRATDVSQRVLERAKSGKFTQLEIQRGLPVHFLIESFSKNESKTDGEMWEIQPQIRHKVRFESLNLLDVPISFGTFDLVLCRNMLIYQELQNKSRIVRAIADRIRPGGFLILGAAENLYGLSEDFDQIAENGAIFYRRKG